MSHVSAKSSFEYSSDIVPRRFSFFFSIPIRTFGLSNKKKKKRREDEEEYYILVCRNYPYSNVRIRVYNKNLKSHFPTESPRLRGAGYRNSRCCKSYYPREYIYIWARANTTAAQPNEWWTWAVRVCVRAAGTRRDVGKVCRYTGKVFIFGIGSWWRCGGKRKTERKKKKLFLPLHCSTQCARARRWLVRANSVPSDGFS